MLKTSYKNLTAPIYTQVLCESLFSFKEVILKTIPINIHRIAKNK